MNARTTKKTTVAKKAAKGAKPTKKAAKPKAEKKASAIDCAARVGVATSSSITTGFAPYIGSGDVFLTINGSGAYTVTGVSPAAVNVSNFGGSGTVTVQYHFMHVPEPSTIALGIAGAVCMAFAYRSRKKR